MCVDECASRGLVARHPLGAGSFAASKTIEPDGRGHLAVCLPVDLLNHFPAGNSFSRQDLAQIALRDTKTGRKGRLAYAEALNMVAEVFHGRMFTFSKHSSQDKSLQRENTQVLRAMPKIAS